MAELDTFPIIFLIFYGFGGSKQNKLGYNEF